MAARTRHARVLAAVLAAAAVTAVLGAAACSADGASSSSTAAATVATLAPTTSAAPQPTPQPAPTTTSPTASAAVSAPEPTASTAPASADLAAVEGRWEGITTVPGLGEEPFAVLIAVSGGQLLGSMDIQGAVGLNLSNIAFDAPRLRFELASPLGLAVWEGELLDGKIEGEFTQSGVNGTFWLGRPGDNTALPERAGHESMFRSEQVTFSNDGIVLAGELTLPDGDGPHPGVVLISGSGDQDRDSSLFGFRVFAALAEHLAELGIASLRFDDRGVGGSTGDGLTTTIQDRADDVEAAVDVLGSRDDVDVDRIGLIGHSEGGLVAPIVANRSESVAFVVLLASSAVPGDDLLRTQQRTLLMLAGATDDEIERAQAFQQLTLDAISTGQGWDEVEASYRDLARQEVQALPEQEREAISDVDTYIDAIVRASLVSWRSPWFKSFVEYDPRPAIAALSVPVFALFGELDSQVAPGINATATSEAIAESNTAGYAIATVAMSNHLFQVATTGSVDEYALLKPEFAPEFLDFLTDWLTAHVGGP